MRGRHVRGFCKDVGVLGGDVRHMDARGADVLGADLMYNTKAVLLGSSHNALELQCRQELGGTFVNGLGWVAPKHVLGESGPQRDRVGPPAYVRAPLCEPVLAQHHIKVTQVSGDQSATAFEGAYGDGSVG
ncbi:hypothetical protein VaNZ11_001192 [Volvox africanus]|uniref:Uncharacterized protein n=1 Tax=Volvox africanus TaxID=51714 RepID=A0ABQ5RP96_9CHLO|nr:hypothetical protein VaNZ11_001192 [Volvox africanus]